MPFVRRYTAEDLRLLAEVDALHGTLSGTTTRKLCERAFRIHVDVRFERLRRADCYQRSRRAVFLYGFAKSERDNIADDELATLRDIATAWLGMDSSRLERALAEGRAEEVDYEQKT